MAYYEIIDTLYTKGVVGCCTDPHDCDEEGHVFGIISKKDYDRYGDRSWSKPKSIRRFKLVPVPKNLVKLGKDESGSKL
jgi:hypothetical protein